MPKTMILRFRDLVTEPGGTVASHNAICEKETYVWWGWWNKSGEQIPDGVFRHLNEIAKTSDGLKILLLDSGRNKLFSTTCREIEWEKSHNRIRSKEPNKTPKYYRDKLYLSWFKIETITEINELELHSLSYLLVDEFFENSQSRYSSFYGKQVHSCAELRQQDRTIWFVREWTANDPIHEVRLLDGKSISPVTYESEFANTRSLNLLWVSDLHFSDHHHNFPSTTSTAARQDLGQAIETSAAKHKIFDFAGILVSGDITWKAEASEFDKAKNFLSRIASSPSRLDNYRIAIIPGNHDIKLSDEPENKEAKVNEEIAPAIARAEYSKFYRDLFYCSPNDYLSCGRKFLLGGSIPVEVACLNSSLIEQKKDWYQGHGFVGEEQLNDVASGMGWSLPAPENRPIRIVMLHHHLMPVHYRTTPFGGKAYSVVFDSEAIVQWIVSHRVDLVLHGHMHEDFCARISRPIDGKPSNEKGWHTFHLLGMGSTGVVGEDKNGPNTYGVLRFTKHGVNVSVFTVDESQPSELVWTVDIPRSQ